MLSNGLLHLATATGEARYAVVARDLIDASLAASTEAGASFGLPGGHDPVLAAQGIAAAVDESDGSYPSGLNAAASAAYRLYLLTADRRYRDAAEAAVARVSRAAAQQPTSHGAALAVLDALAAPVRQLVVVAVPDQIDVPDELDDLGAIARRWRGGLSAAVSVEQSRVFAAAGFELFEGRERPGAYLCENFVCHLPVTTEAELLRLL
jgi:uncharacterized protein YyaL (SSP411 family)